MKRSFNVRIPSRGAAAVELAVVLPFFLLIIFGIVELGRGFMVQHLLSEAARMGVRRAVVAGVSNSDVENTVQEFCSKTLGVKKGKVDVSIQVSRSREDGDDDDREVSDKVNDAESGDMCSVTVAISVNETSIFPAMFFRGGLLSKTCAMERE